MFLWWAGKITTEQSENIETAQQKQTKKEKSILISDKDGNNIELASKELSNSLINKKKTYVNLPDQLPLNANDFLLNKKHSELTEILKIKQEQTKFLCVGTYIFMISILIIVLSLIYN